MKKLVLIFSLFLSIHGIIVNAQIPFEKNGKWGLMDEITNKVISKPQYLSIKAVPNRPNFIVSKHVKTQYEGEKLRFGVINKLGKEVIPIKADSISIFNNYYIFYTKKFVPISENKLRGYPHTDFYNNEGALIISLDGEIESIYTGGIIFASYDIEHRKRFRDLYDRSLKRISTNSVTIEKKGEKFIYIKDDDYRVLDINTFEPVLIVNDLDDKYNNLMWQHYIILHDNSKFGYFDFNTGSSVTPTFSHISTYSEKFPNERRLILYNDVDQDAIAIEDDGTIINGKVISYNNYCGEYLFVTKDSNGLIEFAGSTWFDIHPLDSGYLYTVRDENGWGVLDSDKNVLIFPAVMPAPVVDILRQKYAVIRTPLGSSLYDNSGKLLLTVNEGKIIDCEDGLVYLDNSWGPTGVYSITSSKWIIPYNKYSYIKRLSGGNFACKQGNTHYIISSKGAILNTINNISSISNMDGEYFIRVVDNNGKLGLINNTNGSWIVRCLYEDDIAWGAGKGKNRRFAISQRTDKGELVTVMTVGGQKIASQFFPMALKKEL